MAVEEHIVKFWRGTRDSYDALLKSGHLDYWTKYSVKETTGLWNEYFGCNLITPQNGQLLPVIDIVETVPENLQNGDRYLVGKDATETSPETYNIIEVRVTKGSDGQWKSNSVVLPFDESYTVRVKSRKYKTFQLVDGKLITYDDIDCGTY